MGRLKRERKKFHLKAVGLKGRNDSEVPLEIENNNNPTLPLPTIPDTIFSGINISLDDLKIPAEDIDKKSVRSWKSATTGRQLPKKSKMKLRHDAFLKKLGAFYQDIKEKKLQKKRQSTVITGDMKPLLDALPSFEEIKEKKLQTISVKKKSTQKVKKRQKDALANIDAFKSILQNSKFQKSPLEVITKNILKNLESVADS